MIIKRFYLAYSEKDELYYIGKTNSLNPKYAFQRVLKTKKYRSYDLNDFKVMFANEFDHGLYEDRADLNNETMLKMALIMKLLKMSINYEPISYFIKDVQLLNTCWKAFVLRELKEPKK